MLKRGDVVETIQGMGIVGDAHGKWLLTCVCVCV